MQDPQSLTLEEILGLPTFDRPKPIRKHPSIDLTDLAKTYGLHRVPPIVWDFDEIVWRMGADPAESAVAAFSPDDWTLHLGSLLLKPHWLTSSYNQGRFSRAGAPQLNARDAMRFIVAHELYHAVQDEHTSPDHWSGDIGDSNHDQLPIEREADEKAAQVYKLVKIDGR